MEVNLETSFKQKASAAKSSSGSTETVVLRLLNKGICAYLMGVKGNISKLKILNVIQTQIMSNLFSSQRMSSPFQTQRIPRLSCQISFQHK